MAISSPSKLWSARSWSAYCDNDLNIPQKTADLLVLWNVALFAPQNTPSVLLNNPVNILKNIIEGCSLSQRQSGQICCPSACEADGGALSAECQSMTTLQRASGWPSHHHRHSSGTLVVSQQVSQKHGCCYHICRGPGHPLQRSFEANKCDCFLALFRLSAIELSMVHIEMCIL